MDYIKEWLEMAASKTELFLNEYLEQKYFLCLLGSIFLLGIVSRVVTVSVYNTLIRKSENMISTKNKTLKKIKTKYENSKAVNGEVANPSLMVERYINKYKLMGISLKRLYGVTERCGLACLGLGVLAGIYSYDVHRMAFRALFYLLAGALSAYGLDIYARSGRIKEKHNEIVFIITDFLENTLDYRERRIERAGKLAEQMDNDDELTVRVKKGKNGNTVFEDAKLNEHLPIEAEELFKGEMSPGADGFYGGHITPDKENIYEKDIDLETVDLLAKSYSEENMDDDRNYLRQQEYIISEVLSEFL